MANLHQQLVGARRALLILGWALVLAKVAIAIEANVRAKLDAPTTLADRIAGHGNTLDDDTLAGFVNAPSRDARGRVGIAEGQMIVHFRDGVTGSRCREVLATQRTDLLRVLNDDRNIYLVALAPPQTITSAINQFVVLAEVDYAIPNVLTYAD